MLKPSFVKDTWCLGNGSVSIPLLPALKSENGGSLQSSYGSRLMDTEVTRPLPVLQSEALSQKGQPQTDRHMHSVYF